MGADLFAPSDVPKMVPIGDFRGLDLTPEEGYLLSRIDGRVNVGSLVTMLGWDSGKTHRLLENLLRKHVLNFDRREIADRVFGLGNVEPPSATPIRDTNVTKAVEASATPGVSIELTPVVEKAPDIEIDVSSIEKVPDLEPERCVALLKFAARAERAENVYQIFEIPIGADVKSVKRQYRALALEFHPDKFFRKEIGGYRTKIELSWKKVQEAYELLTNPEKKEAYDRDVLAKQKAKPSAPPPSPSSPKFTPPPPPPSRAPTGQSTAAPEIPPWEGKGSPSKPPEPARARVMSTAERKLVAEIQDRIGKAKRHFEQAQKDLADGKWSNADTDIKLALQFDPKNEEYKAWQEKNKKRIEEGIVNLLLSKAEMGEASQDLKVAADSYEKGLQLFPDNVELNLGYGKLLSFRGDNPRKAKECLQKGLQAHPNDLPGLLAMSRTLRTLGMAKNAQRFVDKAKELAPKDPRVVEEIKELKKAK